MTSLVRIFASITLIMTFDCCGISCVCFSKGNKWETELRVSFPLPSCSIELKTIFDVNMKVDTQVQPCNPSILRWRSGGSKITNSDLARSFQEEEGEGGEYKEEEEVRRNKEGKQRNLMNLNLESKPSFTGLE